MASAPSNSPSTLKQNLSWIREQFPALKLQSNGRPVVFFDGPGGTQVPQRVLDAMNDYLVRSNANHHGAFETARRTAATISAAHSAMADMLGCDDDEVFFGQNMTSLTFALSRAIGRELAPGDEVVVTALDHDANIAPWLALAEKGIVIRWVDINDDTCTLNMHDLTSKITRKTKLVAVGYASNSVGTINHLERIISLAHENGAMVFVDAVHYAPHGPIDVRALDCDFLGCSTYKFFGPHMGVIYGKRAHLERLRPYKVRPASEEVPDRWETGTQNHEGMAGVCGAISYLAELGQRIDPKVDTRRAAIVAAYNAVQSYERELSTQIITGLLAIPGLTFYGIANLDWLDRRTPTVSFTLAGHTPAEIAARLSDAGIFVWDGNFYAISLTERLGLEEKGGLVRVGAVHYNTGEEVERLLQEIKNIAMRKR